MEFSGVATPSKMIVGKVMDRSCQAPRFGQVSIIKSMDNSSIALFEAACGGTVFPSIELHYVSTGDNGKQLAKTVLSDAMVTHDSERHQGEGAPTEVIRLSYSAIERSYTPRDSKNNLGSPVSSGFNLETASAL